MSFPSKEKFVREIYPQSTYAVLGVSPVKAYEISRSAATIVKEVEKDIKNLHPKAYERKYAGGERGMLQRMRTVAETPEELFLAGFVLGRGLKGLLLKNGK